MAFSFKDYEENPKVKEYSDRLSYEPVQIALDALKNREKFSYDVNGDALYQQYKDSYINQGKQAMMDVMGKASAMTGGYGNSYAQTVGQQTYQGYLQGLNDKAPELYQLALDRYNTEGQDLINGYTLEKEKFDTAYNLYNNERNYAYNGALADQSEYIASLEEKSKIADNILMDDNGDPTSVFGKNVISTNKFANAVTVAGFRDTKNDNFKVTFGDQSYYVENKGKVDDTKIIEQLQKISAADNTCIVYGGAMYLKKDGHYYRLGAVGAFGRGDYEKLREELAKDL